MNRHKQYDVVVFGATSFVGQIIARYMHEEFGSGGSLSWAAAGRSKARLESMRQSLGRGAGALDLLVADSGDETSLRQMCSSARVIVSTVGPYALYGEPLLRACAESGTDYCDLAGEPQWIRRMIERYDGVAQRSGARIVSCCGFDSVPFDVGVHFLQRQAQARFGTHCSDVRMRVKTMRGTFSGGTFASMMNLLEEVAANPALRRDLADHYAFCAPDSRPSLRQRDPGFAQYDEDFGSWTAPFVMSAVNTRVVHRSNALANHPYGHDFRYEEAVMTGPGLRGRLNAVGLSTALGALMAAGSVGPTRALLRRLLPAPGEGPSPEAQRKGRYDLRFLGRTKDGRTLRTRVTGDRDPGYGSTAKIISQAAACLALDVPRSETGGGLLTPTVAFGDRLVERLRARAGVQFEVLD